MFDCARSVGDRVQQMQKDCLPVEEVTGFIELLTDDSAGYPVRQCGNCAISLFFEKRPYGSEPAVSWRPILDITGLERDFEEECSRDRVSADGGVPTSTSVHIAPESGS